MSRCGVVIAAAGSSQRMGVALDKTVWPLAGRPVIGWVLDAVAAARGVAEIVVVASERNAEAIRREIAARSQLPPTHVCRGGATRKDSVAAGVACLRPAVDLVLIHDAARPLVTPSIIEAGIAAAERLGAVVAAVPVADTIKQVGPDGRVRATLARDELWAAQTPQVFRRAWLLAAYEADARQPRPVTDEASLVEHAGFPVHVYPGSHENLKLTTPADLAVAEALLRQRLGEVVR
ncbi:MAG: 2-C-methyl-D-erythritol 4-phosphate cytidylyltransferase [Sphaerobacter sp.]|nr:2-C-methyl-D-erythritol 4-phosphate cytidylyltransferase [Sphaerobacter sp.]